MIENIYTTPTDQQASSNNHLTPQNSRKKSSSEQGHRRGYVSLRPHMAPSKPGCHGKTIWQAPAAVQTRGGGGGPELKQRCGPQPCGKTANGRVTPTWPSNQWFCTEWATEALRTGRSTPKSPMLGTCPTAKHYLPLSPEASTGEHESTELHVLHAGLTLNRPLRRSDVNSIVYAIHGCPEGDLKSPIPPLAPYRDSAPRR